MSARNSKSESGSVKSRDLPLLAIVGRPNVGKSTIFNRLTGKRRAIVGDEPGITRDRIYGEVEWAGRRLAVVDTGGIIPDDDAIIPAKILKQAEVAIQESQALLMVVDARKGITPVDESLAQLLRATGKPVFVLANKVDVRQLEDEVTEFYQFGFEEVFPVSAEQGTGLSELLEALIERLPEPQETSNDPEHKPEIRLAIVGRPNVGKSSLLNQLLGEERAIVSPVAGTTRDSVDTILETAEQRFRIIDTAGIRRKGKTEQMAEKLSVVMARKSLERADVAVVLIDAVEGVTALDANIAGYAHDAGCSIILAVNKWDALEDKDTSSASTFERQLRDKMKFLSWAPVVTISALKGLRVDRILADSVRAQEARLTRIPTSQLNAFFEREVARASGGSPAPARGGESRLRVQYITQIGLAPPTFVVFTSGGRPGLHFSYERYLLNRLREEFVFFATPLRIIERHKKSVRRAR